MLKDGILSRMFKGEVVNLGKLKEEDWTQRGNIWYTYFRPTHNCSHHNLSIGLILEAPNNIIKSVKTRIVEFTPPHGRHDLGVQLFQEDRDRAVEVIKSILEMDEEKRSKK